MIANFSLLGVERSNIYASVTAPFSSLTTSVATVHPSVPTCKFLKRFDRPRVRELCPILPPRRRAINRPRIRDCVHRFLLDEQAFGRSTRPRLRANPFSLTARLCVLDESVPPHDRVVPLPSHLAVQQSRAIILTRRSLHIALELHLAQTNEP